MEKALHSKNLIIVTLGLIFSNNQQMPDKIIVFWLMSIAGLCLMYVD